MAKKISDNIKNHIVKLYCESNLSYIEISNILNVSIATIRNVIREQKVALRSKTRYMDIGRAISMYELGYYVDEICHNTNVPKTLLYQELDKKNIPRRKNFSSVNRETKGSKYTKRVIDLYNDGKSKSEISRELEVSLNTISIIISKELEKGNIEIRDCDIKKEKEKEKIDNIAKLYILFKSEEKPTIRCIAQEMGVEEQKLYHAIRKYSL